MSDSGSITATIETIPQGWFYTRYLGASSISFTPPGNSSGDIRKNDIGEGKNKPFKELAFNEGISYRSSSCSFHLC